FKAMCGIFGIVFGKDERVDRETSRQLVLSLLTLSETRGREAAGLAVHDGQRIEVLKQSGSVSAFLASDRLRGVLDRAFERHEQAKRSGGAWLALAGHTRLVTNGFQSNDDNNQPVIT